MHHPSYVQRHSVGGGDGDHDVTDSQQQALRAAPHRRELARGSVLSKHPSENGFRSEGFKQKKTSGGAR